MPIKLVILDFDGVLTRGKIYDANGNCLGKEISDLDWTAIKAFKSLDIPVVILSGDNFNATIAEKRKIPFYSSINQDGLIDKETILYKICSDYNVELRDVVYIGDDLFDVEVLNKVGHPFVPCNASAIEYVNNSWHLLTGKSGESLVNEILFRLVKLSLIDKPDINKIKEVDRQERIS